MWVEDEKRLLDEGVYYLEQHGYKVYKALCYKDAYEFLKLRDMELIILDWLLPDKEGLEICKEVQSHWKIPVIMVTAKTDEFDKVLALELGADDYLTKPFGMRELLARIKAVSRRMNKWDELEEKVMHRGDLEIDPIRYIVRKRGEAISLTPTEFAILKVLARSPGRVVSRLQLLDEALGDAFIGYERTLDSHIRNLRRKIEDDTDNHKYVLSVYGVGYKFAE